MDYIIFDLETTLTPDKTGVRQIVEIGAVRVRRIQGKLAVAGKFQVYVRPKNAWTLTKKTLEFIGADREDFKRAVHLSQATRRLKRWIGGSRKNHYLCSWSSSDLWILAQNNRTRGIDLSWVKNFIDIQPAISFALTGNEKEIALEHAFDLSNGESENTKYHSALTDSFGAAILFIDHYETIAERLSVNTNPFSIVSSRLFKICPRCEKNTRIFATHRSGPCRNCRNVRRMENRMKRQRENEKELKDSFS